MHAAWLKDAAGSRLQLVAIAQAGERVFPRLAPTLPSGRCRSLAKLAKSHQPGAWIPHGPTLSADHRRGLRLPNFDTCAPA